MIEQGNKKTIWKYTIEVIRDHVSLAIPEGARFLGAHQFPVAPDKGTIVRHPLMMWFIVDPIMPKRTRWFRILGTGNPIEEDWDLTHYLTTVQDGPFFWHIFMEGDDGQDT